MTNPFKDKNGIIVLAQKPNWQILTAFTLRILQEIVPKGRVEDGFKLAFNFFLIIWAYEEIFKGVNLFRRALGFTVFVFVFINLLG